MAADTQRHTLLDDGFPPTPCDVLVVGCGNILRGDDAVGPVLIRRLWEDGVPADVRIVDGGTAGMDVAFQMRGAQRVVVVDASSTGASPGTVYRVPGEELADTGPLDGLHTHSFRWDHALTFARWLLGPDCPTDITVFLIEVAELTPGAELSREVRAAMEQVIEMIRNEFFDGPGIDDHVEVTDSGHLRIPAALAAACFPADACGLGLVERQSHPELHMIPLQGPANGGQLLKQRNLAGDRVILVRETLSDDLPVGNHRTRWDQTLGVLVVDLAPRELDRDDRQSG